MKMQFFSGSQHPFKPGDKILPSAIAKAGRNHEESNPDHAYASKSPDEAGYFAVLGRNPDYRTHNVYEVKPIGGKVQRDPVDNNDTSVVSTRGFHVIRQLPKEEWSYGKGRQIVHSGSGKRVPIPGLDSPSTL